MSHTVILDKKKDRLHKHTGRRLRLRLAAYKKALARFESKKANAEQTKVESAEPEWIVSLMEREIKVFASSEREARAEARKVLGLTKLPSKTLIKKVLTA